MLGFLNYENSLAFDMRRHNDTKLKILAIEIAAQMSCQMAELDTGHQLIKANPGILTYQELLSKLPCRVLLLKEFHEVNEQLSMQLFPDNKTFFPVLV